MPPSSKTIMNFGIVPEKASTEARLLEQDDDGLVQALITSLKLEEDG